MSTPRRSQKQDSKLESELRRAAQLFTLSRYEARLILLRAMAVSEATRERIRSRLRSPSSIIASSAAKASFSQSPRSFVTDGIRWTVR
jgi:hypothetical protein